MAHSHKTCRLYTAKGNQRTNKQQREKERDTETETERDRERQRETQRERQRERQTERNLLRNAGTSHLIRCTSSGASGSVVHCQKSPPSHPPTPTFFSLWSDDHLRGEKISSLYPSRAVCAQYLHTL